MVWDTYVPNATGANAELEAYDVSSGALASCSSAAPCSLSPIFSAPIGTAAKFTVGQVTRTPKGSTTRIPVTFPVALAKGDKLNAAVTFTPAAPGGADGTLSFSTQSVAFPTLAVPLAGDGTQTGLEAQPTTIAFPLAPDQGVTDVPVGTAVPQVVVDITNYGTTADTVTSGTPPSGPFTAIGLPASAPRSCRASRSPSRSRSRRAARVPPAARSRWTAVTGQAPR